MLGHQTRDNAIPVISASPEAGSSRFRQDIQGLRATAVLAVILNHLEVPGFSGGFVGVDIFFVISGYLITRQLAEEFRKSHAVDLASFYLRRFRRLFPAAIATCLITLVAAFLLSPQEKLEMLADATLASLVGLANIHFWREVGYFDAEASSKPLLHMWSLGVEEQFYLFWPLMLLFGLRLLSARGLILAIAVVGLISFLLNVLWLDTTLPSWFNTLNGWARRLENPAESAFYLMPFRVFEFCLGALVAIQRGSAMKASSYPAAGSALRWLAVGVIGYAILRFDASTIFPYWNALIVAGASALLILLGPGSFLLRRALTHPAMVYVGTISYSLYLVHWPVIVFYRDLHGALDATDVALVVAITALLAVALYRWVESPARIHTRLSISANQRHPGMPTILACMALLATAFAATKLPQVEDRVPEHRQTLTTREWRQLERDAYCHRPIRGLPLQIFACQLDRGAIKTLIIWGDSHAMHLVAGFAENFPSYNIAVADFSACAHQSGFGGFVRQMGAKTQACVEHNQRVLDWLRRSPEGFVVLLSSAKRDKADRMADINNLLTGQLRAAGHEAWVLGDYIRPGRWIAGCRAVPDFIITDNHLSRICQPDAKSVVSEIAYGQEMKRLNNFYIPLHDVQCPSPDDCRFTDDRQQATFMDTHHLSPRGSVFEIRQAHALLTADITALRQSANIRN